MGRRHEMGEGQYNNIKSSTENWGTVQVRGEWYKAVKRLEIVTIVNS